jgi:hypothetical protein
MATKIQRAHRIGGIAIGAVKTIFRTGRAWGSTRTRVATARRPAATVPSGATIGVAVAGGAAGAYFLDPQNGERRRQVALDRAKALLPGEAAEGEPKTREDAGVATSTAYEAAGAGDGAGSRPAPTKEAVGAGR